MSVRQYVGARYVPKFATPVEWNSALSYEALTIVTHLGNSFTSKIPVPAGIDIGNTEYWVNTGNFNAQVEDYREQVNQLQTTVNDLTASLNQLQTQILSYQVNVPTQKKIIFISDSYGISPTQATSWSQLAAENMGIVDQCYFQNKSGGGFTVNGGNQFLDALNEATVSNPQEITDIVVGGGLNDAVGGPNTAAILNNINAFANAAKNKYPNAKIWIGFMGNAKFGQIGNKVINDVYLLNTMAYYKRAAATNGCTYILNAEQVLQDWSNMGNDGIHPNALGSQLLANIVVSTILNGGYNVTSKGDWMLFNAITGGTINGSDSDVNVGLSYFTGNIGWFNKNNMTFVFSDGIEIGNSYVKLANYQNTVTFFNSPYEWEQTCQVTGDLATTYVNAPFLFKMEQGEFSAKALYIKNPVFETHVYKNIIIPPTTLIVPTLR